MRIYFRLKSIEEIKQDLSYLDNYTVSWLDLTDGDLWIEINEKRLFIYSQNIMEHWKTDDKFVDYQLDTFTVYFSNLFEFICKSLSKKLYDLFNNLEDVVKFNNVLNEYFAIYEDENEERYNAFIPYYHKISNLCYGRMLSEYPPTGSPCLYFFRHKDKIKVIWDCEIKNEIGIPLWEADSGIYEMPYIDFVEEVKRFFDKFIKAMEVQIENALKTDWGHLKINKDLAKRYPDIKQAYLNDLAFLDKNIEENNEEIEQIYQQVLSEIAENYKNE
ncbi:DUF5984 family protein [Pasteurella atlantica]|uniref:DUF5984 family protein n=1 Tax=Pasteurellaceae TaxID=712 RepID=UPI00275265C9|nr:DUF5984 family protein [Pasteurella atlantica]MDP8033949.1 DUF5984 family protein [Pasteurella atlantica]MDP8035822.1 DUF5984 family protein [Pasteurella atlantica]MDP8037833.1 DUF5984 family protein [Pasteurella atlantica]MDP8048191.1 DUF5984 family protein [Pasteurella atlantica]MDP8050151.1 DUF5984 family protein [Pasteurella atlantica]